MLFDGLKTEKDLEALKRRILRDNVLYARFCGVRDKIYHKDNVDDNTVVWSKIKPYLGTEKKKMPTNAEMLVFYRALVRSGEQEPSRHVEQLLRKIKVRSNSGVAVVSLLTKPYACPGKCIYCPTEKEMPKSYLSKEPAAARALANNFDPYEQVTNRLRALVANGHPVDKLEVIVIGGTWSFYDNEYKQEFISEIFRAANNFLAGDDEKIKKGVQTLEELQKTNEITGARVIGLSIETRPDHIDEKELEELRRYGVTKVEIGVQHLDDEILEYNKRGITTKEVARVTELLRNTGFKVVYHMMPNLPKSTPEMDIAMFKKLFSGKDFHPDMIKIYPCVVLKKSELYEIWKQGEFKAYTDEELTNILISVKKEIPLYVRLIRVIRDIPATYIMAGSKISNLRQIIQQDQKNNGWQCRCIRCREVRNEEVLLEDYILSRIEYETQTGKEIFLSFEHKNRKENKCAAFCRLRLPDKKATNDLSGNLSVLKGAAIIRELHTYGQLVRISEEGSQSQHRGFGRRLMDEAESIAREEGYEKMAVISGVGVREYYKNKLGYELDRTYMVKEL
ncbi:MAG: tRNA uridine(34) 5-carboxymethylaminomethyl modification radical SAM/GNAT enzyme Elp3 [Candidatus Pacebacteria bacterium]|nr:tRNA uridine(34) 5-carboxymethylaminomethyl modification radical SAM/GNAT enzyme Elp3 [Candidatus Paceibacterota bacterium]